MTGEHPKDIMPALRALVRDGLQTQQNQRRTKLSAATEPRGSGQPPPGYPWVT